MLIENISTPIYVECDKMYQSKVCVQEFLYFVSSLDIQLEQSKNDNSVCKKVNSRLRDKRIIYCFFRKSILTYGSVFKVSRRESGDLGFIPAGCGNSLQPLGRFAWH